MGPLDVAATVKDATLGGVIHTLAPSDRAAVGDDSIRSLNWESLKSGLPPRATWLALDDRRSVRPQDLSLGQPVRTIGTPSGRMIAVVGKDRVDFADLRAGQLVGGLLRSAASGERAAIHMWAGAADSDRLAITYSWPRNDKTTYVVVMELTEANELLEVCRIQVDDSVRCVALSPRGRCLVCSLRSGRILIADVDAGRVVEERPGQALYVSGCVRLEAGEWMPERPQGVMAVNWSWLWFVHGPVATLYSLGEKGPVLQRTVEFASRIRLDSAPYNCVSGSGRYALVAGVVGDSARLDLVDVEGAVLTDNVAALGCVSESILEWPSGVTDLLTSTAGHDYVLRGGGAAAL